MTARPTTSVIAGFRFPPEVIWLAVRWYLQYGLPYRDAGELPAERGITVDHLSVYRWGAAAHPGVHRGRSPVPPCSRRPVVRRRDVPEGSRTVDLSLPGGRSAWPGHRRPAAGQARDLAAARRFFTRALGAGTIPAQVTTDRAPACPRVLDELIPTALHTGEQDADNPAEADHAEVPSRHRLRVAFDDLALAI